MRRRRLLQAAGAALVLGGAKHSRAHSVDPLVVWFTIEGASGMRRAAQAFTRDTGVPVVVETPDEPPSKFQQAAAAGKGPDIFVYAHDRIGEWIAGGLLHDVTPSRAIYDDIEPLAWKGFGVRGRLWGYPYAIEAITLIYNKALVSRPPASMEELFALDAKLQRDGRHAILWDYTNPYFTWPLLAAGGAYAYPQRPDGSYDPHQTGVNLPGAVLGAELLERMIRQGLMPSGSAYAAMEAGMAQGRVAMMINGPWAWVNLKKLGMDFGVARIPTVQGQKARPFVGIKGLMINRATRQRELAVEFIENYLLQPAGLRAIDHAEPIGAPASKSYFKELSADAHIVGIMESAQDGVPTPSIPEIGRFWSALESALTTLTQGRQTARQALDAAAHRIVSA